MAETQNRLEILLDDSGCLSVLKGCDADYFSQRAKIMLSAAGIGAQPIGLHEMAFFPHPSPDVVGVLSNMLGETVKDTRSKDTRFHHTTVGADILMIEFGIFPPEAQVA